MLFLVIFLCISTINFVNCGGILYPQESESREIKSLDGIWNFRLGPKSNHKIGFSQKWYSQPLENTGEVEMMPVPSSYNDITQKKEIRDHIGWVWYDRHFWIHESWTKEKKVFLRFGGVNYHAIVWINGEQVLEHSGAHLPFVAEIPLVYFKFNDKNLITVAVNNTLTGDTVPQGYVKHAPDSRYPEDYITMTYPFDFFNYAGIHRSVFLFTTPQTHIEDIYISTKIVNGKGEVDYRVDVVSTKNSYSDLIPDQFTQVSVSLIDKIGNIVAENNGLSGKLVVSEPKLWWPFTMVKNDSDAGYLHTLVVTVEDTVLRTKDVYRLKIGIRSIKWDDKSLLINDKPFYFRGFGRHEDFNIRGKGIDNVMIVKDHNLVKWTGANSYRTSHYPYSEEIMDLTDQLGIVVIDECSAVSLSHFGAKLLENHKMGLRELMNRDKNRPSVVMWSVGNEPKSQLPEAEPYFREIVNMTKGLDATRPVTIVVAQEYDSEKTAQFVDIICINRYYSWYSDTGHTEIIKNLMVTDVHNWIEKFNKPLIVSEYGADTIAGMHNSPEYVFSEEYQLELMREHFKAFDELRKNTTLIGEHIWNFADFMTAQGITRVTGNRKGIFTRERQPKASAHLLRARYHYLALENDQYPLPDDLKNQIPIYS